MTIRYPEILEIRSEPSVRAWSEKDAILYALGLGFGSDGLERDELRYVYEQDQKVVPTFVVILQRGLGVGAEALGVDYRRLVHGEQSVTLHRAIAPSGAVKGFGSVAAVYDKGDRGSLVVLDTELRDASSDARVATCRTTLFARGDVNSGAPPGESSPPAPPPTREPDGCAVLSVPANQALIYRLSGDLNPLHVDPSVASMAGFKRPILHGLSTFGMAARALARAFPDVDLEELGGLRARFSAPVFPGEAIVFDYWREGPSFVFQARTISRESVVLKDGRAHLRPA